MSVPKFVKYILAAAVAVVGLAVPEVGAEPAANAAPLIPMMGYPGPVNSYAMGDGFNCFLDYTMWINRDPVQPKRVVVHFQPRGVRSTIPGVAAPATCSATLNAESATDRNPVNMVDVLYHINGNKAGGAPVQYDLPYQPDASWVNVFSVPLSGYIAGGAYPVPDPTAAFALR